MRTGLEILRELADIGRLAEAVETEESKLRWLMRLGCLCAEAEDYIARYEGKREELAS